MNTNLAFVLIRHEGPVVTFEGVLGEIKRLFSPKRAFCNEIVSCRPCYLRWYLMRCHAAHLEE